MRYALIVILLLAAAMVSADEPIIVLYECHADNAIEEEFCTGLHAAMMRTKSVIFYNKSIKSYFHVTVLPAAREGYLSVLITSNYVTPPFKPLELSAFSGIWVASPGTDSIVLADDIATDTVDGTREWIEWTKSKKKAVSGDMHPIKARYGGGDE